MLFPRNMRCLVCSEEFGISEAPVVPIGTPASSQTRRSNTAPKSRLDRLPLGHNRVCPHCNWPLTYGQATGQLSLLPIAIAGGTAVSKSHYIPILIDQAKNRLRTTLPGFDIRAQETREPDAATSACSDQLLAIRYGQLFCDHQQGTVMAKTPRSGTHADPRTPLIYRFTFPGNWWTLGSRRCVEFAIRDCAGEEFIESNALQEFHRYICHSAGIMLLIDPSTMPGLRERLPQGAVGGQGNDHPFDADQIISRLIGLFERVENARVGARIDIPLAIVITKADLLRDMAGPAAAMFREPEPLHNGGFNCLGVQRHEEMLRQLLADCGQSGMLSSVEAKFRKVGLFAASALGHQPIVDSNGSGEQRVGSIQPWRVLDPLVWLLHHHGFVKGNKEAAACFS